MKYVFILMTQWKDGDPEISGVFTSFYKAAAFFVRIMFQDATMSVVEMQSKVTQVALKLAHMTDDEDFADFGNMRGWIEKHEVDERSKAFEKGDGDDGE
jgi:hypothetical protein